jgi:hypothetical protein
MSAPSEYPSQRLYVWAEAPGKPLSPGIAPPVTGHIPQNALTVSGH